MKIESELTYEQALELYNKEKDVKERLKELDSDKYYKLFPSYRAKLGKNKVLEIVRYSNRNLKDTELTGYLSTLIKYRNELGL